MNNNTASARPATLPAFLGKEWREMLRQSRALIILAPLFIFAILNPVMIKLLPKLLGAQMGQLSAVIQVGAPDAVQSFFKNLGDISVFVFVLALMGTIAEERSAGAYLIPFSRRVQRWQAVLAKFATYVLVLTAGLIGSALLARYYVGVLFAAEFPISGFVTAALIDAAYYWFILGILLLFSALFKRGFAAGIITLVTASLMPALGVIPSLRHYTPNNLLGAAIAIAIGGPAPAGTTTAVVIALCVGALGVAGAGLALERAEL